MNILITGGAGFIGSKLAAHLFSLNHEIFIIDNFTEQVHGGDAQNTKVALRKIATVIEDDICNLVNYSDMLANVELVYHLASSTGTSQSMYAIQDYYRNNVENTALLIDFLRSSCKKVTKVILSSSRAVYGEGAYRLNDQTVYPLPRRFSDLSNGEFRCSYMGNFEVESVATREDAEPSPSSVYGVTKLLQEVILNAYQKQTGTEVLIFRFQNVYGPGQSLINPYTGVLGVFSNLLRQHQPIEIYEQAALKRDFVYIDDIIFVLSEVLTKKATHAIMNIGSGQPCSILHLAQLLKKYYQSDSEIRITNKFRLGDILCCFADLNQLNQFCHFYPTPVEVGLKLYCDWVCTQNVPGSILEKINESFSKDELIRNKLN